MARFFLNWMEAEQDEKVRKQLIQVIHSWLHSPEILVFFRQLQEKQNVSAWEYLLAELYLFQHGTRGDRVKFQRAVDELSKGGNEEFLMSVTEEMPDEAFVPWLLGVVEENPKEQYGNYQWLLERITLRRDVWGRSAWRTWASENSEGGREIWRRNATENLIELAKGNPNAAVKFMDKATYRWKSPDMLGSMERLAEYKLLHNGIVGWINLTYAHYHHVPNLPSELEKLGKRIAQESGASLEPWAKRLMNGWDFVRQEQPSWEDFVRASNRVM